MRRLACFLGLLALSTTVAAQGDREAQGLSREQMWPAPTAEDWKKPCLIQWQRTWKDAVAVSRETGKPILVCINMDGEIASEHYAGVRYRQPEIAELYKDYVTVIASTYRHNPRDHDDEGNRILCPRFGSVTCGEHIWIEPIIFEKFCDGRRVAPRHICVDLEGKEVYDVYYTNDTASVFDAVRDGRKKLPPAKAPVVRGDRPILERVASRDLRDRDAVEAAYRNGDRALRSALLEKALQNADAEQIDLLRLAIFGLDAEMSQAARKALVKVDNPDATQLVSDALQVPMESAEREALIAALKRLGDKSPLARWLAGVHQGLGAPSGTVKLKGWSPKRAGAEYAAPFGGRIYEKADAALEKPDDPAVRIDLAEATLALALKSDQLWALNKRLARMAERQLYEDAQRIANEAGELGAPKWRVESVLALAAYYSGKVENSYGHAAKAVKELPAGDSGWGSMAVVTIFAESRWKSIKAAVREQKEWPPEWLTDLNAAYTLLLRHPLGTDGQVLWFYEFLDWLGIRYRAARVLEEGLARFRTSAKLHEKLRDRVLRFRGAGALESTYDELLKKHNDPARLAPFAGYACVVAAQLHRRRHKYDEALASYDRAIAHYESAIAADPANRPACDEAIALALAGRARVAYQVKDDEKAVDAILASFARSPSSAGTQDGMGIRPGETAQVLLARLREEKKEELAGKLSAAMAKLDPELLRTERELLDR